VTRFSRAARNALPARRNERRDHYGDWNEQTHYTHVYFTAARGSATLAFSGGDLRQRPDFFVDLPREVALGYIQIVFALQIHP